MRFFDVQRYFPDHLIRGGVYRRVRLFSMQTNKWYYDSVSIQYKKQEPYPQKVRSCSALEAAKWLLPTT